MKIKHQLCVSQSDVATGVKTDYHETADILTLAALMCVSSEEKVIKMQFAHEQYEQSRDRRENVCTAAGKTMLQSHTSLQQMLVRLAHM